MMMSQDELYLYAVTARVVDELTSGGLMFTALDVSNAVKQTVAEARHREISPIVRDIFERRGMGAYMQTSIDVMAQGNKPARALLYHLPEQSPAMYDDSMRAQLAVPPQRLQKVDDQQQVGSSSTEAHVRVGKDGRGRVPRALIENAGIKGDRVLVKSYPAVPSLQIVAPGPTPVAAPTDPTAVQGDVFFPVTDNGQPLNYEHPSLLHLPRSLLDIFGTDPNLVAKIDGASVVIVKR
ncbi:MAG TPA: hypothetical protein VIV40_01420 [Kofleriaceae bacterium]